VTVTDNCDNAAQHTVRNTGGVWVVKGNYCGVTGAGDCQWTGNYAYCELIEGNKKQNQVGEFYGHCDETPCQGDCNGVDIEGAALCNAYGYMSQGDCIWSLAPGYKICKCTVGYCPTCGGNHGCCNGVRTKDLTYSAWECP
jgi:hypothetical protein